MPREFAQVTVPPIGPECSDGDHARAPNRIHGAGLSVLTCGAAITLIVVLGIVRSLQRPEWMSPVLFVGLLGFLPALVLALRQRGSDQEPADMLRRAVGCLPGMVLLLDRKGRIEWASEKFLEGMDREWWQLRHQCLGPVLTGAEVDPAVVIAFEQAMARGDAMQVELSLVWGSRPDCWAEITLAPVPAGQGRPSGWVVVVHDVTARVETAQALEASEARFRSALSAMQEGFVLHGADGAILMANPAAERILGLTESQLCGRGSLDPRWQCVRADGAPFPGCEHPSMQTLVSGQPQTGVVMGVRKPSGELTWISISTSPVGALEDARPRMVVTTFSDISEHRRTVTELRKLTRAVDQSPALTWMADSQHRIEYVNNALLEATGYRREELIGRDPRMLAAEDLSNETYRSMQASIAADQSWRGELTNRRRDGSSFPVALSMFPLRDERGAVTHFVGIEQDISQARERERQLGLAREDARVAAEAKREFLQNMSHELRTPMNGILGMAELLLETQLEPQQRADLITLRRSAQALTDVIRQLFEFTKLESASDAIAAVPFRLRECLEHVSARFLAQAEAKGLRLIAAIEDSVPDRVVGDPGALRQILMNLLENAVKFTAQGSVALRVQALSESAGTVRLMFSIEDSGIGIAPDRQRAIFEAFEQADGSNTRQYGGIGLGLTVASFLVRQFGGVLEVESAQGRGSVFRFTIPVQRSGLQAPPATAPITLAGMSLLVVDGGGGVRTGLIRTLEGWGMQPCVAAQAQGAVAAAEQAIAAGHALRVAVLDQRGAQVDAFGVAACLRDALGVNAPAMLVLTSVGERGDGERCRALGVAGYFTAPVEEAELQAALCLILQDESGLAQSPTLITRHLLRETRTLERVLLVEDNPVNRKVAVRMLERSGYDVSVAVDGQDAIEQYRATRFALILMDIQMPVLNGIDATRAIRALEHELGSARTPIIAVTAHALAEDRQACLLAGMDAVVPKPIQRDELLAVMSRWSGCGTASDPQVCPPCLLGLLDWEQALGRMDGDAAVLHELLDLFRQDSPNMLLRLDAGCASADARGIERAAHGLKGASATISADPITALALRIESAAREGRVADAIDAVPALRAELERLVAALRELAPVRREAA